MMVRTFALLGVLFSGFLVWLIVSADAGRTNPLFELAHAIPFGDKLGHMLLFGTLTLFAVVGSNFRRVSFGRLSLGRLSLGPLEVRPYLGAVVVAIVVIIEECSQQYFPSRSFDGYDLVADGVGILLFSLMSLYLEKRLSTGNETSRRA
ncbi:trypsin [Shewanella halotolerans]|uniref:trypsin n=1 Tax=Shewanella halotolerans TaxID=2864204 RepID=UPI001C661665|nr:trypsin [Shewanella halotolerans]QYJ90747.1 trypsin [Shewanella halotolerans]